ncbi:hypothetical protein [Desulforhopalus sp. 52FAK]
MAIRRKSRKIVNLKDVAFERDMEKAKDELTDYFVKKNRQVKAAQLETAFRSSLRKRLFSVTEAKRLTEYLAIKFDIRRPAIQYAQAGYLAPGATVKNNSNKAEKKVELRQIKRKSEGIFVELFQRLQAAVQDNLLDYNGARVLVRETVDYYPVAQDKLRR